MSSITNYTSNDSAVDDSVFDVTDVDGNPIYGTSSTSGGSSGASAEQILQIDTNATGITSNDTDIATNTTGISTNVTDISTNTTAIGTNTTTISTNTGNIGTNTTAIGTNTTTISTNTGNIGTNTTAISTLNSTKVDLEGDLMLGPLDMGVHKITTTYTPVDGPDLINKTFLDNIVQASGASPEILALNTPTFVVTDITTNAQFEAVNTTGDDTYTVIASSRLLTGTDYHPYKCFDREVLTPYDGTSAGARWLTDSGTYTTLTGAATGSDTFAGSDGSWITISTPVDRGVASVQIARLQLETPSPSLIRVLVSDTQSTAIGDNQEILAPTTVVWDQDLVESIYLKSSVIPLAAVAGKFITLQILAMTSGQASDFGHVAEIYYEGLYTPAGFPAKTITGTLNTDILTANSITAPSILNTATTFTGNECVTKTHLNTLISGSYPALVTPEMTAATHGTGVDLFTATASSEWEAGTDGRVAFRCFDQKLLSDPDAVDSRARWVTADGYNPTTGWADPATAAWFEGEYGHWVDITCATKSGISAVQLGKRDNFNDATVFSFRLLYLDASGVWQVEFTKASGEVEFVTGLSQDFTLDSPIASTSFRIQILRKGLSGSPNDVTGLAEIYFKGATVNEIDYDGTTNLNTDNLTATSVTAPSIQSTALYFLGKECVTKDHLNFAIELANPIIFNDTLQYEKKITGDLTTDVLFANTIAVPSINIPRNGTLHIENSETSTYPYTTYFTNTQTPVATVSEISSLYNSISVKGTQNANYLYVATNECDFDSSGDLNWVVVDYNRFQLGYSQTSTCQEANVILSRAAIINGSTVDTLKMISVVLSNSGTIGYVYGLHIGDLAAQGTHTATPYGIYQQGTGDRNYIGGPTEFATSIRSQSIQNANASFTGQECITKDHLDSVVGTLQTASTDNVTNTTAVASGDDCIARYDGITGKQLKSDNTTVTLDSVGNLKNMKTVIIGSDTATTQGSLEVNSESSNVNGFVGTTMTGFSNTVTELGATSLTDLVGMESLAVATTSSGGLDTVTSAKFGVEIAAGADTNNSTCIEILPLVGSGWNWFGHAGLTIGDQKGSVIHSEFPHAILQIGVNDKNEFRGPVILDKGYTDIKKSTVPSNPDSQHVRLYIDASEELHVLDSTGNDITMEGKFHTHASTDITDWTNTVTLSGSPALVINGSNNDISGTASVITNILDVIPTDTSTADHRLVNNAVKVLNPGFDVTNITGTRSEMIIASDNIVTQVRANHSLISNNSNTGTIGQAIGYYSDIENNGNDTITGAYHFYADSPANPTGTINDITGLHIAPQNIGTNTTAKGIHQEGVNDINIFEGDTTMGTVNVGSLTHDLGWKDNIQSFAAAKVNGTSPPAWDEMSNASGLYAYSFTDNNEVFVFFHVTHDYAVGTKAYPHVHFLLDTVGVAGQEVVWDFKYNIAKGHTVGNPAGGSLTGTPTIIAFSYVYTGTEVAGEHIIAECSDLQAFDLLEADAIVYASVKLISKPAVGKVFGLCCDLHYQSISETTPLRVSPFNN